MSADDLEAALRDLDLLERNGAWKLLAGVLAQRVIDEKAARNDVNAKGGAAERETHLHSFLLAEELAGWVAKRRAELEAQLKDARKGSDWVAT